MDAHIRLGNGQSKCIWCGKHVDHNPCLSDQHKLELAQYAQENGPRWKSKLCQEWLQEKDTLRFIRNSLGTYGIHRIKTSLLNRYLKRVAQ